MKACFRFHSPRCENHPRGKFSVHTDRQAVSFCLSIVSCTRKVGGVKAGYVQGGVTPIDSIVTAATAGQSFDRLFSAV